MKKIPLNQIKKKINLKRFLEIAGPSSNYGEKICRSGIFESVALASLGNILLEELNTKVTDKVTKIKIEEVIKMLPTLDKTSKVKDDDLTNLLQYYDLIQEVKNVQIQA